MSCVSEGMNHGYLCPVTFARTQSAQNSRLALIRYFYKYRNMKHTDHSPPDIVEAAAAFAALGSEQRLTVLHCIVRAGPEGLSIGELGERSGVTGSTLTHHMRILSTAGLVEQAKQGRKIICIAANYQRVSALSSFLLRECCADATTNTNGHDHG